MLDNNNGCTSGDFVDPSDGSVTNGGNQGDVVVGAEVVDGVVIELPIGATLWNE
jgi:hypothetical protein